MGVERLRMPPGAQQRFLYQILGTLPVAAGQPQRVGEQRVPVLVVNARSSSASWSLMTNPLPLAGAPRCHRWRITSCHARIVQPRVIQVMQAAVHAFSQRADDALTASS